MNSPQRLRLLGRSLMNSNMKFTCRTATDDFIDDPLLAASSFDVRIN